MKRLTKRFFAFTGFLLSASVVFAKPKVNLSLWVDDGNVNLITKRLDDFKSHYGKEAHFNFTVIQQSSSTCGTTVRANPEIAADIFTFADDQFNDLMKDKLLLEVTENTERIIQESGGRGSSIVLAAMSDGKLYSYPEVTGNGYFLYYNKKYFTEEDVKSMDRILEICAASNKKMAMDLKNGWYIYSFFKGAGLEVYITDVNSNFCNWNSKTEKIKGLDVAKGILKIAGHSGFISVDNDEMMKRLVQGEVIACVNGAWNANLVAETWGKDIAATKLPEYTVAGQQVQMSSFAGYKMVGINSRTANPEWAMKVAEWITNAKSQYMIYEKTGECPANMTVASSPAIKFTPAVAALSQQAPYSDVQRVANSYWNPSRILGVVLSEGSKFNDSILQLQLDNTVRDIQNLK